MNTLKMKCLPLFLLATIGFLFAACKGNEPTQNNSNDLEGYITLKMRNVDNGNTWLQLPDVSCFHISSANNFQVYVGEIVDVGTKNLSKIKSLPTTGWAYEVEVQPKHGYIYKYDSWNIYLKVKVIDFIYSTSGGIIGAEMKYCEWTPEQ